MEWDTAIDGLSDRTSTLFFIARVETTNSTTINNFIKFKKLLNKK